MPILRPCKTTAAFEGLPDDPKLQVDLSKVRTALDAEGWELVADAVVMVILRREVEVSVFRSGKMLIKTRDPEAALAAFQAVHPHLEPDASHEPKLEGMARHARQAPQGAAARTQSTQTG